MKNMITAAATVLLWTAAAQGKGVDKLYVLDCGWSHNADVARWTPGINVGQAY